jgi:hypothetical protein
MNRSCKWVLLLLPDQKGSRATAASCTFLWVCRTSFILTPLGVYEFHCQFALYMAVLSWVHQEAPFALATPPAGTHSISAALDTFTARKVLELTGTARAQHLSVDLVGPTGVSAAHSISVDALWKVRRELHHCSTVSVKAVDIHFGLLKAFVQSLCKCLMVSLLMLEHALVSADRAWSRQEPSQHQPWVLPLSLASSGGSRRRPMISNCWTAQQ